MLPAVPFLGTVMAIFFGLCILVFGVQFFPGSAYLELNDDGFSVVHQFREKTYNWADIEEFSTHKFTGNKIVTWTYTKAFQVQDSDRTLANRVMKTEASLPDSYGMTAEDLAKMMNALRQKYR